MIVSMSSLAPAVMAMQQLSVPVMAISGGPDGEVVSLSPAIFSESLG